MKAGEWRVEHKFISHSDNRNVIVLLDFEFYILKYIDWL